MEAVVVAITLEILVFALCSYSGNFIMFIFMPIVYQVLNLAYSFGLKNYPLIDVVILTLGFLLRLLYGGKVTGCGVSTWVYLTMMSVSFFIGFGKRLGELQKVGLDSRTTLHKYDELFLEQGKIMSCTMTIIFYALTCANADSFLAKKEIDLLWPVPVVVVIILRYLMARRKQ